MNFCFSSTLSQKNAKKALLRYEELETVLLETEAILNSCPLTIVYEDISEPLLTPFCLVTGRRLLDRNKKHQIRIFRDEDVTAIQGQLKFILFFIYVVY